MGILYFRRTGHSNSYEEGCCLPYIVDLVDSFWEWTECSEDHRGCDITQLSIEAVEFPLLHEMQNCCAKLINHPLTDEELDAFLMCMAVDNECECILAVCKTQANDDFVYQIVSTGIQHSQSQTRWQMAELLRRNILNGDVFLKSLMCDMNEYVRKRALNVWSEMMRDV